MTTAHLHAIKQQAVGRRWEFPSSLPLTFPRPPAPPSRLLRAGVWAPGERPRHEEAPHGLTTTRSTCPSQLPPPQVTPEVGRTRDRALWMEPVVGPCRGPGLFLMQNRASATSGIWHISSGSGGGQSLHQRPPGLPGGDLRCPRRRGEAGTPAAPLPRGCLSRGDSGGPTPTRTQRGAGPGVHPARRWAA